MNHASIVKSRHNIDYLWGNCSIGSHEIRRGGIVPTHCELRLISENEYGYRSSRSVYHARGKWVNCYRFHESVQLSMISREEFVVIQVSGPCCPQKRHDKSTSLSANSSGCLNVRRCSLRLAVNYHQSYPRNIYPCAEH